MPRPNDVVPGPQPVPRGPTTARWGLNRLRDLRVRSKLLVIIVIPLAAVILLGALRFAGAFGNALEYSRVHDHALLSGQLATLAHDLELERDLTVGYVAQGRKPTAVDKLKAQYGNVDRIMREVRGRVEHSAASDNGTRARAVLNRLGELPSVRSAATNSQISPRTVIRLYHQIVRDLLAYNNSVDRGAVDEELANSVAAFQAISRAKEHASVERAIMVAGLTSRRLEPALLEELRAARAQRDSELAAFRDSATIAQNQTYDDTVTGQLVDRAEGITARAILLAEAHSPLIDRAFGRTSSRWFEASSSTIDRMREVEADMAQSISLRSRALMDAEQGDATATAAAVAVLLVIVGVVTSVMAHSLIRPLRRLRSEALRIATKQLPATVLELRSRSTAEPLIVPPVDVVSCDEVGEVARAFDEVHREAVRLAGEEARLRANVNAMFVNLSRRSQTLVERQISLIEGLEQGEEDEKRLADLYKLDHLATRMRRNSENLLVLAGQEQPRRWNEPIKLIDVIRAAQQEVEGFERVAIDPNMPSGALLAGKALNDVAHLLAELIENALSFSPRETRVRVVAERLEPGQVALSISDQGIGLTIEDLEDANQRLTQAHEVDVSVSRRMGLFVVAKLSQKHGITVHLRPNTPSGLTALVVLPAKLLVWESPSATPRWRHDRLPADTGSWNRPHSRSIPDPTGPEITAPGVCLPSATTGPPVQDEEHLPIYAQVESAWFARGGKPRWDSTDAGWKAAAALAEPARDGTTEVGLPRRVPKANLVPGTVHSAKPAAATSASVDSPAVRRTRLADFQAGLSKARRQLAGQAIPTDPQQRQRQEGS